MTYFKTPFSFSTLVISFFMMLMLSSSASANNADVNAAQKRVIDVTSKIVNLLKQNEALYTRDINALNGMIRREVLPFIDFESMSKLTLGKHWRSASPAQRTRFISAFREMMIRSYAKTMLKYTGAKVAPGNSIASKKPGYATVRTKVSPQSGSAINAEYSLRKVGNDWKAFNVKIAGISLVANFRVNFTREVDDKGLNSLITRLERSGR